jgi:hypothetical protein
MAVRPVRGAGCLLAGLLFLGLAGYGALELAGVAVPWWCLALDAAAWLTVAVVLLLARPLDPPSGE